MMLKLVIVSAFLTLTLSQSYYNIEDDPDAEPREESMDPFSMESLFSMGTVDIFGQIQKNIPVDEILDNSTDSGLASTIETYFSMLRPDMCDRTVADCSSAMFLDCNCIKQFTTMKNDDCNGLLCDVYEGIWNNLAEYIKAFMKMDSFEEVFEYYKQNIMPGVMDYTCDCKDQLFKSSISCVSKYDSTMLRAMLEGGYSEYKKIMQTIDWKAIQKWFEALAKHACSMIDDKPCYESHMEVWQTVARYFDNTFNGEGGACESFSEIIGGAAKNRRENIGVEESFLNMLTTYYDQNKQFVCNPKCAKIYKKTFLDDCCNIAILKDKSIAKNYLKFWDSIISMVTSGEVKKLSDKAKKMIKQIMDPLTMCKSVKKIKKAWKTVVPTCKKNGKFYA